MCLPPEVSDNMGCTGSIVYPSDTIEKRKPANGVTISTKNDNHNFLKGDYSQMQFAKHNRDKYLKQRQSKTFIAANEMSGRIMEERELLSLGTRSRGTSRNTSRTASPTTGRKSLVIKEELPGAMTPVAEDLHSQNSRRLTNNDDEEEELLRLQKKGKIKSTHKASTPRSKTIKKQKSPRVSKQKGKPKKNRKGKKTKGVKFSKEPLIEADNIDSGLEDNVEDDHCSDAEEEEHENVASDTHKNDAADSDNDGGELEQDVIKDSGIGVDDGNDNHCVNGNNAGVTEIYGALDVDKSNENTDLVAGNSNNGVVVNEDTGIQIETKNTAENAETKVDNEIHTNDDVANLVSDTQTKDGDISHEATDIQSIHSEITHENKTVKDRNDSSENNEERNEKASFVEDAESLNDKLVENKI